MKNNDFKLIMISAMYENGGNTTHRLLDGHPQLYVYPFESQPGTKYVNDYLASLYPQKYRWPIFPNSISPKEAYDLIMDEEAKIRSKTPFVSKFRNTDFQMSDRDRLEAFLKIVRNRPLDRPTIIEAFFKATFLAWKNHRKSGQERFYVGYSPIIGVDGDKIINDYRGNAFVIHVVRNPFSAYAETKKRPVPLSLAHYVTGWLMCQHHAKLFEAKFPRNFFVIRYETIIKNSKKTLGDILVKLGLKPSESLKTPSWNGEELSEVYPWGTIRRPTGDANLRTARELKKAEIEEIYLRTKDYVEAFHYADIYKVIR
jgi:hypothetical protein